MTVAVKLESLTNDATPDNAADLALSLPPLPDPIIDQLHNLVSSSNLNTDPTNIQIRAAALFARLKALNRTANASVKAHKQVTADVRSEMDHTHLGLQNLLYEKRHLEREIEKCRQFGSIYQDIALHTVEEFLSIAPEEIRTDEVMQNEHQLMLHRLSFELSERQRLDQKKKDLTQQKEELLKQSKAKTATLNGVKGQLDLLMKTASDTQKKVDEVVKTIPEPETT